MRRVYLDHNATTPQASEVTDAMRPFFEDKFGNPSSTHREGQEVRNAMEAARERVARFLGARAEEMVFTSGGTESINLAILGSAAGRHGGHVVTTSMEHPAGMEACRQLEGMGVSVTYVSPGDDGAVREDDLEASLRPDTFLVSVMHSNNETGVLQPLSRIAAICRERRIRFHTDAVQSAGKVPLGVSDPPVDLLSLAGPKLYGPKGVGALYVRRGVELPPLFHGGGQERRIRSGTPPVALVVGLGKAVELERNLPERFESRIGPLREKLETAVIRNIPGTRIHGEGSSRLPNTSSIGFSGLRGEELLIRLDLEGFAVSTGAACSSGTHRPSHVLLAMGQDPETARETARFSLGWENRSEEVELLLGRLPGIVEQLRDRRADRSAPVRTDHV
ncbi:MAG: cysteine desulfurase family protein [Acidobacteriota bacterium]